MRVVGDVRDYRWPAGSFLYCAVYCFRPVFCILRRCLLVVICCLSHSSHFLFYCSRPISRIIAISSLSSTFLFYAFTYCLSLSHCVSDHSFSLVSCTRCGSHSCILPLFYPVALNAELHIDDVTLCFVVALSLCHCVISSRHQMIFLDRPV